ncbi:MAG: hypothetical protein ACI9J2_002211 [Saprospiraceae bacterium]|jgi:hypothetical protein
MKKVNISPNQSRDQSKAESVKTSRRSFLRTGIAATGGVAAAIAINGSAQAASDEVTEVVPKDEGYRVTEHVSAYYKSVEV